MSYVKSFNRLVWEKRDYRDEVAPQSPDLNPIETLWSHLGKRVRMQKCSSKRELETKLHEEWQKIDPTTCNNLVNYMQKRIKAVIKAKGGHTTYWLLLLMFTSLFLTFKYISLNHNFDFSLVLHNFGKGCMHIYIYIWINTTYQNGLHIAKSLICMINVQYILFSWAQNTPIKKSEIMLYMSCFLISTFCIYLCTLVHTQWFKVLPKSIFALTFYIFTQPSTSKSMWYKANLTESFRVFFLDRLP